MRPYNHTALHRRFRKTSIFITGFTIVLHTNTSAQVNGNIAENFTTPKQTSLLFSRNLNIYEWVYLFQYRKRLTENFAMNIRENFRSTLQQQSINKDRWKDEQSLNILFDFQLSEQWWLNSNFKSYIFSDLLAGFDQDVKYNAGSGGMKFKPTANLTFTSTASAKWQTQLQQRDNGFGIAASGQLTDFDLSDYRNNLFISGQQDFFPKRRNNDVSLRYSIQRQFYKSTGDTLTIFMERLRRDSYDTSPDNTNGRTLFIRNLSQTQKGVENRFSYRLSNKSTLYAKTALLSNSFRVDSVGLENGGSKKKKDESGFEARNSINLNIQAEQWFSSVGWNYRFRTRDDHNESSPDPFGNFPTIGFDTEDILVGLSLRTGLKFTRSDSVGLDATITKFQYDTSKKVNPNDHDQIRWKITLSHLHKFSKDLLLRWQLNSFYNHFVFISHKLSNQNNEERTFQLKPEITYNPGNHFLFRQGFIVRAKYQTFDFDDAEISNRNLVTRQFILTNNTNYEFSITSSINLNFYIELKEQGKFFADLWRQGLALSENKIEFQLLYRHRLGAGWQITSGGSIFKQTRWEHRAKAGGGLRKIVNNKHTNYGPLWELTYRPNNSLELLFSGNIQFIESSKNTTDSIKNIDLALNWYL